MNRLCGRARSTASLANQSSPRIDLATIPTDLGASERTANRIGCPSACTMLCRRNVVRGSGGSRLIICFPSAEVGGEVACGGDGVGMVGAQHPAAAVQGVLLQVPGGLHLPQPAQGVAEIVGRAQSVRMIGAEHLSMAVPAVLV